MSGATTVLVDLLGWPAQLPDHRAAALASCVAATILVFFLALARLEARLGSSGLEEAFRQGACAALPAFSVFLLATGRCRPLGVAVGTLGAVSAGLLSVALGRASRSRLRLAAPAIAAVVALEITTLVAGGPDAALFVLILAGCAALLALAFAFIARTRAGGAIPPLALAAAWLEVGAWVRFASCPHCVVHTLFF